jgi:thioredoxin-related protein
MLKQTLFFLLLASSLSGQNGIHFSEGSWAQLLEKAALENKIIFLDAQTAWCGPCRKMARDEFPDSLLGNYYNAHFVNVTMDMEKGEGLGLGQKYGIMAYPTLLFIDKKGKVLHSGVGYHTARQLLDLATEAADPNRRFSAWEEAFRNGNKEADFLYMFANKLTDSTDSLHSLVAEAYLATQMDWKTEKNLNFIWAHTFEPKGKRFDFLLENKNMFDERQGQEAVFQKIDALLISEAYDAKTGQTPQQMERYYTQMFGEQAPKIRALHTVAYYKATMDTPKLEEAINTYIKNYTPEDTDEYRRFAIALFNVPNNKKALKRAISWMKPVFENEKKEENAYILALMYLKSKQKCKAKTILQQFLDLNPALKTKTTAKKLLKELEKR